MRHSSKTVALTGWSLHHFWKRWNVPCGILETRNRLCDYFTNVNKKRSLW
jgi:hypothetical protein